MKVIRKGVFETNSSSCHSLTVCDEFSYEESKIENTMKNFPKEVWVQTLFNYYDYDCGDKMAGELNEKLAYVFACIANQTEWRDLDQDNFENEFIARVVAKDKWKYVVSVVQDYFNTSREIEVHYDSEWNGDLLATFREYNVIANEDAYLTYDEFLTYSDDYATRDLFDPSYRPLLERFLFSKDSNVVMEYC